jgi:hypothetical protein
MSDPQEDRYSVDCDNIEEEGLGLVRRAKP